MTSQVRTLNFLPEIFRTSSNQQFLSATLDQLVTPPKLDKIEGYIGRKFEYGLTASDTYIPETNSIRQHYQLEPSVVFTKSNTSTAVDVLTYPGLIDALAAENGSVVNHSKLFQNQFYSWDSFVDMDKLVNFSQYYWLPDGPDSVEITTDLLHNELLFIVKDETIDYSFTANDKALGKNPEIKLLRGGTYTFQVDPASKMYIQTSPGISGVDPARNNVSSREIYGVDGNGNGIITFTVPHVNDQDSFIYANSIFVDLISTIPFDSIHGKALSTFKNLDNVNILNDKIIMFYGFAPNQTARIVNFYDDGTLDNLTFDSSTPTVVNNYFYKISLVADETGDPLISLSEYKQIPTNQKITITNGKQFIGKSFVRNEFGEIILLPPITANLDTLYYQDSKNSLKTGTIKLIDNQDSHAINIETGILGKRNYTSPLGVKFTNGLKVYFTGLVYPQNYKNKNYYVEGVGSSIYLVPESELLVPEKFTENVYKYYDTENFDTSGFSERLNVPVNKDYITINRKAQNRNAWSRSNRWFHIDVLKNTIKYTNGSIAQNALNNQLNRANRPIIEFYPNLKLFNTGTVHKSFVDFIDTVTTNVDSQILGQTSYMIDTSIPLFDGARIVFTKDNNIEVKNKIFIVKFQKLSVNATPVITLTNTPEDVVLPDEQVVSLKNNINKVYYFNGSNWNSSQAKTLINQPPLFDVFDINGISFSNQSYYNGSNFAGSKLFSYAIGTGGNDSVLGFPIKYSSVSNVGDISFNVNFNSDSFNFIKNTISTTYKITDGYVHNYTSRTKYNRKIGWETAKGESFQYQAFDINYLIGPSNPSLIFNILPVDDTATPWPITKLFIDSVEQTADQYTVTKSTAKNQTTISLLNPPKSNTLLQILIYSNDPLDPNAYYTIPSNLANNPFNVDIEELSLGDLKGQYQSIFTNSRKITGDVFGSNNFRDSGDLIPYGTKIIRNSASLVNTAVFLRNREYNLIDALTFNEYQYIKFKQLLLNTVDQSDYTPYMSGATMLDDALQQIASYKQESESFFWSDMLPARAPYISKNYVFNTFIDTSFFPLSRIYDFDNANYYSVLVYLNYVENGITTSEQLVRGRDYIVSKTEPKLQITKDLLPGQSITVNEYNNTYGSYVPNTPSKLGLYPAVEPGIVLDNTYLIPTYFIRGHDGSLTKLYGDYQYSVLKDFKDKVLLEFETRIYNNIKVSASIPIKEEDIIPGYFRNTGNSLEEIQKIYTGNFLDWVGKNNIDYANQFYSPSEKFTWNYAGGVDKFGKRVIQGFWRGIYLWYFDTTTPHSTPWEMLGLVNKPTWWDGKYGAAPYTSENKVLWTDIEAGKINGTVNPARARPRLSKILPVDSYGNLKNPFTSVVNEYTDAVFDKDWQVGDMGPAEYSYRKSSNYPFDLIKILALMKPAKFFALAQDLDLYAFSSEFNQYMLDGFQHDNKIPLLYGSGTAQHSYMNWIVDYVQNTGHVGYDKVSSLLNNLDVRLTYRVAGFTDKEYLNFYLEKSSTNSNNASLLLPNESYNVLLYQNQVTNIIRFSSIIIQKTAAGYKVSGNSQTRAYFITYVSKNTGNTSYEEITVNGITVNIPILYEKTITYVPYGIEFTSPQELSEFIVNYGRYLTDQGLIFENQENGFILNWNQIVAEVLYWVSAGWENGSLINVNPSANRLVIDKENLIVQPLTLHNQNYALNQNLFAINISDLGITRDGTRFEIKPLNDGDTIAYFTAQMSSLEHIVVFDNKSLFNDTIFNSQTGLRQNRLFLRGLKSAEWNGTMNAQGFILNQDNIEAWTSNIKYTKGSIVTYQNKYWMANKVIPPSLTFNVNDWIETNYAHIQKGLLPNASTRAAESVLYYDINNANLKNDGDVLGFSLIGYRPRDYLAASDLSDISQVNLFKTMISEKGTKNIIDAVQNIKLDIGPITYDVYENWAIKTSEYGGVANKNFIEIVLDKKLLTGNPNIIGIVKDVPETYLMQTIPLSMPNGNFSNFGVPITSTNILPIKTGDNLELLPTAGYVNFNDIKIHSFLYETLNNNAVSIKDLYQGDYIWLADELSTWTVLTPVPMGTINNVLRVVNVINNLNGTCSIVFDNFHNLPIYATFMIINYDASVNGFYRVNKVIDSNTVQVDLSLPASTSAITATGICAKFQKQRIASTKYISDLKLINDGVGNQKIWVDGDSNSNWTVIQKTINYKFIDTVKLGSTQRFGESIAYDDDAGVFVGDPSLGTVYRYAPLNQLNTVSSYELKETINLGSNYGTAIAKSNDILVVTAPSDASSKIYIYALHKSNHTAIKLNQTITISGKKVGETVALSGDKNWLFFSSINESTVYVYRLDEKLTRTLTGYSTAYTIKAGDTKFTVSGDQSDSLGHGDKVCFSSTGIFYTIEVATYNSALNLTTFFLNGSFKTDIDLATPIYKATYIYSSISSLSIANVIPAWSSLKTYSPNDIVYYNGFTYIGISQSNSNKNPSTQTSDWKLSNTDFGRTISSNYDGTKIFIGAPTFDFTTNLYNMGKVYVYNRIVQQAQIDTNTLTWTDRTAPLAWTPVNPIRIYRNGVYLEPNTDYTASTNTVTFKYTLNIAAGDIITVSSGDFVYTQELIPYDYSTSIRSGILFGNGLDTNKFGTEVLVGSPIDISSDNIEGAVYRYTHEGKSYGTLTGTRPVTLSSPATILINGIAINLPGTGINDIINTIQNVYSGRLYNIGAEKLPNNCLKLYLKFSVTSRLNEKLEITVFDKSVIDSLGFSEYTKTQVIREVHGVTDPCHFGYTIKFNEYNSFAVSATKSSKFLPTTFDFVDDGNANNDTYFDNNFTRWVDFYAGVGAVYIYDYIPENNENLNNLGKYVFSQSCNDLTTNKGKNTNYGKRLVFTNYNLVIGIPDYFESSFPSLGRITVYRNLSKTPNWSPYRKPVDYVDIDKITGVQLYNNVTNERLVSLDYIDPQQGKLLGVVTTNLDYIGNIDPAGYNVSNRNNKQVWASDYIGKLWFNTSTAKFNSYHQDDILYNSSHWGTVFPESTVTVYSWIESNITPVNYVGNGRPYNIELYSTTVEVDNTGSLVLKYYFWVRNTNIVFTNKGKTLADTNLELYIANPITSGIPFFAAYKPNVFGLYNAGEFINDVTTSLYIGFSTSNNDTPAYNEFKLIRAGYEDDFISGLPSIYAQNTKPEALYEKLLDSFAGLDSQGNVIPDINLPKLMQTGVAYRPRQSLFKNRLKALKNYFGYANNVLKQHPIAEFRTPSLLGSSNTSSSTVRVPTLFTILGSDFDTTKYWEYVYWWAEGYSVNTKIDVEVPKYYGLATLTPYTGMIAGVTSNGEGKREVYAHDGTTWNRVGLEQGTIQLLDSLWDYEKNKIGFDNNFFDLNAFDAYPSMETRYIVRALNEEVYTETLRVHRNKSLILMFEYIVGENTTSQNNLTWLNKTSLVDVHHTLRELAQDKNYKRDNQTFLDGYINEVKPYRVVIKEFLLKYNALDSYTGQITDFDLPGRYDNKTIKFITPNLVFDAVRDNGQFLPNDSIWTDSTYSDWYNNYGLSLTGKKNYPITTLAAYVDLVSDEIHLTDAYGFPVIGRIKIDNEFIDYSIVDRKNGKLMNLTRGVNGSKIATHNPPTTVYIDLPGVVLLDTGRNYIDPPTISAIVDTSIYPAPTRPALLEPVMSNGKLIDIIVLDPGAGYTNKPEILIQPSITVFFDSNNINYQEHTIQISKIPLVTGDVVKYTMGPNTNGISGLENKKYYYVRVINSDLLFRKNSVIALYKTKQDALVDNHRVVLVSNYSTIKNKLEVTARAVPIISNTPTREITTTIKFDRTSYRTKVEPWISGEFYGSIVTATGAESSLGTLLDYAIPYPGLIANSDTKGAVFTVFNILLNYTYDVQITSTGTLYSVGNTLTIKGNNLGGTTPLNDCVLTVTQVSGIGEIQKVTITGTPATVTRISKQEAVLPITNITLTNTTTAIASSGSLVGNTFIAGGTLTNTFVKGMTLSGGTIPANTVYITDVVVNTLNVTCSGAKTVQYIDGILPQVGMVVTGDTVPENTRVTKVLGKTITLSANVPANKKLKIVAKFYKVNTTSASPKTSIAITGTIGNAVVSLNYGKTNLSPGQIKGLELYFYKLKTPYTYVDSRSGGATIKIYSPNFSVQQLENKYFIEIVDSGTRYSSGDVLTIKGSLLGGLDTVNNLQIKVIYTILGGISLYELVGISSKSFNKFYVKPLTSTNIALYYDAPLQNPVLSYDFILFTTNDYAFIPEPIYITSGHTRNIYSLVTFNNVLYRCVASNNDTTFDFNKWEIVKSDDPVLNALDRTMGYYAPTENMLGKNLPMLISGIDYPNNTYFGQSFDDNTNVLDTVLKDQIFYPRNISLRGVTFGSNGVFVACGETNDYSIILISYDNGENWSLNKISKTKLEVQDIVHHDGRYVVVTQTPTSPIVISNNLVSWISAGDFTPYDSSNFDITPFDSTSIFAPKDKLNSVSYHNNLYFSAGNEVITSLDSYSWKSTFNLKSKLPQEFKRISYVSSLGFDGYLAVGYGTITAVENTMTTLQSTSRVFRSLDGYTWEEVLPRVTTSSLNVLISSGSIIIVAGDDCNVFTSSNTYHWVQATISDSNTDNLLNGTFANNTFVIVGENGRILISYDGVNWDGMISNTNQRLTSVSYNGTHWIVVGDNATILRSVDTFVWENVSLIKSDQDFYEIKGDSFMSGYGPEELIPGAITDTLTMTVITRPGSTWSAADFGYTGFTVKSFTHKLTEENIYFSTITENPAQLSVFLMDKSNSSGIKVYPNITTTLTNQYTYTIDWVQQTIALSAYDVDMLNDDTKYLHIEVYEFGNGNQEIRSNSQNMPMRIDPISKHTEIWLGYAYDEGTYNNPVVYHNGEKLVYLTDYVVSTTTTKEAKLLFSTAYHPSNDYLSFVVMGPAISEVEGNVAHSIPETQVFVYPDDFASPFTVTLLNYVESTSNGYSIIVDFNGLRLSPSSDYILTLDPTSLIGTVTLTGIQPTTGDILSVTSFNDTRHQYLLTEVVNTLKVNPIFYVNTDKGNLAISISSAPEFVTGDLILIDGIIGTTQLNNRSFYVSISDTVYIEDGTSFYSLSLYYDSVLVTPVTGKVLTKYISGGYIWKASNIHQINQPDFTLQNTDRLYVTSNGKRIDNSRLRINNDNTVNILEEINIGDVVIFTSMIPTPTPNKMIYVNQVDKNGEQLIYRANLGVSTWLTKNLEMLDNQIYVENVARVIDLVTQSVVAVKVDNSIACFVNYAVETIKEVEIYNTSTLTNINPSNITLSIKNSRPIIYIRSGVSVGDNLKVSLRLGDLINIDGEIISYKKVNTANNTILGITRGVKGSGVRKLHSQYTVVSGIKPTNTLFSYYYDRTWNSEIYSAEGDPLQVSDSFPANFLQVGTE